MYDLPHIPKPAFPGPEGWPPHPLERDLPDWPIDPRIVDLIAERREAFDQWKEAKTCKDKPGMRAANKREKEINEEIDRLAALIDTDNAWEVRNFHAAHSTDNECARELLLWLVEGDDKPHEPWSLPDAATLKRVIADRSTPANVRKWAKQKLPIASDPAYLADREERRRWYRECRLGDLANGTKEGPNAQSLDRYHQHRKRFQGNLDEQLQKDIDDPKLEDCRRKFAAFWLKTRQANRKKQEASNTEPADTPAIVDAV